MGETRTEGLREALRAVRDPATGKDIVTAGFVETVLFKDGLAQVVLTVPRERAPSFESVRKEAEATLAKQPGVESATAIITARHTAPKPPPSAQSPRRSLRHAAAALLPEVGAIVAVASGKGGVGKSTVAVNLAVALARLGLTIGLLDADIYGPSLPRMLGLSRKPEISNGRLEPIPVWGLKAMSIGFLVEEEQAMIWRGPMVMGALEQMMGQVNWGKLDIMIVDMPPGTGDAQLTMAQRVKLTGAVIVSTPQDIALIDARRGARMFEKTHVPVLGIVENMSFFFCPHCGERSDIFGHGGAEREASRLRVPFLGAIPLLLSIRETGDAGKPIVASDPKGPAAAAFAAVAERVKEEVGRVRAAAAPAPRIVVN